jgi:hypothetical protein
LRYRQSTAAAAAAATDKRRHGPVCLPYAHLLLHGRRPPRLALPGSSHKMTQSPMISVPLKATNEIDWVGPLKSYIRDTYGDDPERYAEECATLNRLRQDIRGAGKDSTSGRDMLYRYYGQLELLDLRFPVDEQHIKISFTWYVLLELAAAVRRRIRRLLC